MSFILLAILLLISFLGAKYRVSQYQLPKGFEAEINSVLESSHGYSAKLSRGRIGAVLILYSIVKDEIGVAFQILKTSDFKSQQFIADVESELEEQNARPKANENARLTREAEKCLVKTLQIAGKNGNKMANSAHLLMALTLTKSIIAIQNTYQIPTSSSIHLVLDKYAPPKAEA